MTTRSARARLADEGDEVTSMKPDPEPSDDDPKVTKPKRTYTRKPRVQAEVKSEPTPEATSTPSWTPGAETFINLKGKLYLPARRRVQWMRGNPEAHPDWTIDTEIVDHVRGVRVSASRVEGGYACIRANLYDTAGRLIATGLKSEYSENFADYLEKAETGAVARALALAGYGTESALDLDEGVDGGRIADAPVVPSITSSKVSGVGRGGHTPSPNDLQIREVARLSRDLQLEAEALLEVASRHTTATLPVLPPDEGTERGPVMRAFFESMTSDEVGQVINELRQFTNDQVIAVDSSSDDALTPTDLN